MIVYHGTSDISPIVDPHKSKYPIIICATSTPNNPYGPMVYELKVPDWAILGWFPMDSSGPTKEDSLERVLDRLYFYGGKRVEGINITKYDEIWVLVVKGSIENPDKVYPKSTPPFELSNTRIAANLFALKWKALQKPTYIAITNPDAEYIIVLRKNVKKSTGEMIFIPAYKVNLREIKTSLENLLKNSKIEEVSDNDIRYSNNQFTFLLGKNLNPKETYSIKIKEFEINGKKVKGIVVKILKDGRWVTDFPTMAMKYVIDNYFEMKGNEKILTKEDVINYIKKINSLQTISKVEDTIPTRIKQIQKFILE